MPAQYMALRHIGQGSQEVYILQPSNLNTPNFLQASLIADTSACAVGSLLGTTLFAPVAIISPSFTITAPNGPPPLLIFSFDRFMATFINLISFSLILLSL